ncbi:MAG: hypothetical protein RTV72_14830 [Candidatus Thorarchaeota archaeon]
MQIGDIFGELGWIFGLIIAGLIIIIVAGCIAFQISDLRGDYRKAKEEEKRKHLNPEG